MLAAGLAAIYVPVGTFPRYSVALVLGIGSGAAMIPFSMMKEANPSEVKGTAAGVMNFLVFLTTGVMSPFISRLMVPTAANRPLTLAQFQTAFLPLVGGVILAIVLSLFLKETGTRTLKVVRTTPRPSESPSTPEGSRPPPVREMERAASVRLDPVAITTQGERKTQPARQASDCPPTMICPR